MDTIPLALTSWSQVHQRGQWPALVRAVAAEASRENLASRALFESMGFRRTRSCDRLERRPGGRGLPCASNP